MVLPKPPRFADKVHLSRAIPQLRTAFTIPVQLFYPRPAALLKRRGLPTSRAQPSRVYIKNECPFPTLATQSRQRSFAHERPVIKQISAWISSLLSISFSVSLSLSLCVIQETMFVSWFPPPASPPSHRQHYCKRRNESDR